MLPKFKTEFQTLLKLGKDQLHKMAFIEPLTNVFSKGMMSKSFTQHFNPDILHHYKEIDVESFRKFYYNLIVDKKLRKMLTIVIYGHGKDTNLNVDHEILYDHLNSTSTTYQ